MRILIAAVLGASFCLAGVKAATIELADGRRLQADIIEKNNRAYVLSMFGGQVQIPRSMVVNVSDEADNQEVVRAGEIRLLPSADGRVTVFGSGAPAPDRGQKVERKPIDVTREPEVVDEVQFPLPADPVALTNLQDTLNSLRSNDPTAIAAARQAFAEFGDEGLGVLARYGLYHESPTVRTASAYLLGSLGGDKALGVLIQAFYAAAHPTIQPYQVNFVEELTAQISRLSGVDFTFYPRQGNEAPIVARRMVEWWRANYATLPRQLGEPELDRDDPDYVTRLWSFRNLPLERRQFAGFNLPPDFVPPAGPATEEEMSFAATIPIIPRNLTLERNTSSSLMPASNRTDESMYTPGDWRRDQYLSRMLGEMQSGDLGRGL